MANLRDTDNFIVSRGTDAHTYTYSDLKTSLDDDGIGSAPEPTAPIINDVTLTEGNQSANRFSGESFVASVSMFNTGDPVAQKGFRYRVDATYEGKAITDTLVSATSNNLTFASNTNLDQLNEGNVLFSEVPASIDPIGIPTGALDGSGDGYFIFQNVNSYQYQYNDQTTWWVSANNHQVAMIRPTSSSFTTYWTTTGQSTSGRTFTEGSNTASPSMNPAIEASTGRSILNMDGSGQNRIWYSPDGNNWSQVGSSVKGSLRQNYSYVLSGQKVWCFDYNEVYYSGNLGNTWSSQTNQPNYSNMTDVRCSITCRDHAVLWGRGPGNSGNATVLFTGLNGTTVSSNDFQVISSPFSSAGPDNLGIYPHLDGEDGFIYTGRKSSVGCFYSLDQCKTWNNVWLNGLQPGESTDKYSLAYDHEHGFWYLFVSQDGGKLYQCGGIGKDWVLIGCPKMSNNSLTFSGDKGIAYHANTDTLTIQAQISNNIYYGFTSGRIERQKLYQTIVFPNGTDLSFLNPGDRLTQGRTYSNYGTYTATAVVQETPTNNEVTVYTTDTVGNFDGGKFTNEQPVYYAPTQSYFGVRSTNGNSVTGLVDCANYTPSDYVGKTFESNVIQLNNATRYLDATPSGQVTGFINDPDDRLTFLDVDTLSFPTYAPSGDTWDVELPAGTSLTVEVFADNTSGGGGRSPNNGYYTATVTPGGAFFSNSDDVDAVEIRMATMPYRKIVFENDLANRRLDLIADLQAQGFTSDQIDDVI